MSYKDLEKRRTYYRNKRKENPEKARFIDRQKYKNRSLKTINRIKLYKINFYKIHPNYQQEYWKKYINKPDYKIKNTLRMKKYLSNPYNREKHYARNKVWRNIKTGKLIKSPCLICGAIKVEAHHKDHSKPLEIIWLCRKHHTEADKNMI